MIDPDYGLGPGSVPRPRVSLRGFHDGIRRLHSTDLIFDMNELGMRSRPQYLTIRITLYNVILFASAKWKERGKK